MQKNLYLYNRNEQIALVKADTAEEAFAVLQEYEKEPYLTHGQTAACLQKIGTTTDQDGGVIAYCAR